MGWLTSIILFRGKVLLIITLKTLENTNAKIVLKRTHLGSLLSVTKGYLLATGVLWLNFVEITW